MSTEERTFNPTLSTNEVFREYDMTRCLSDDLNATDDTSTEKRIMKTLTIYDDKIVGNVINSKGDRNDVVLRAVY